MTFITCLGIIFLHGCIFGLTTYKAELFVAGIFTVVLTGVLGFGIYANFNIAKSDTIIVKRSDVNVVKLKDRVIFEYKDIVLTKFDLCEYNSTSDFEYSINYNHYGNKIIPSFNALDCVQK